MSERVGCRSRLVRWIFASRLLRTDAAFRCCGRRYCPLLHLAGKSQDVVWNRFPVLARLGGPLPESAGAIASDRIRGLRDRRRHGVEPLIRDAAAGSPRRSTSPGATSFRPACPRGAPGEVLPVAQPGPATLTPAGGAGQSAARKASRSSPTPPARERRQPPDRTSNPQRKQRGRKRMTVEQRAARGLAGGGLLADPPAHALAAVDEGSADVGDAVVDEASRRTGPGFVLDGQVTVGSPVPPGVWLPPPGHRTAGAGAPRDDSRNSRAGASTAGRSVRRGSCRLAGWIRRDPRTPLGYDCSARMPWTRRPTGRQSPPESALRVTELLHA